MSQLKVEVRAAADGSRAIEGYAAVFGKLSHDLGGFREMLAPRCFSRALAGNPDIVCSVNHDDDYRMVGRTSSGTCRVKQDDNGLHFRCDLPDTQAGRDLYEQVKRGDMNQCSFAFDVDDDDWTEENDPTDPDNEEDDEENSRSYIKRTINSVRKVYDVSVVNNGAYPQTSVATC